MYCEWGERIPENHSHGKLMTINDNGGQTTVPSTAEFLAGQASDSACRQISSNVSTPGLDYTYDRKRFLVRRSRINGSLQKVVLVDLGQNPLWLSYYPPLAGHPGARRMYDTLHLNYYYPILIMMFTNDSAGANYA